MDLNIENLIMMYEKCLRELKDANKCFNITDEASRDIVLTPKAKKEKKDELRVIFEEICFVARVKDDEVISYLDFLDERVIKIENVIDHHFELIKQSLIDDKKQQMRKRFEIINKQTPN